MICSNLEEHFPITNETALRDWALQRFLVLIWSQSSANRQQDVRMRDGTSVPDQLPFGIRYTQRIVVIECAVHVDLFGRFVEIGSKISRCCGRCSRTTVVNFINYDGVWQLTLPMSSVRCRRSRVFEIDRTLDMRFTSASSYGQTQTYTSLRTGDYSLPKPPVMMTKR